MSITRIASRYAKSLLDLSVEKGNVEAVVDDIKSFANIADHREFFLLLKSPIVNGTKKKQIFDTLFGGKVQKETAAFFDIILRKGREAYLPEIADSFLDQYKASKGVSSIELTTAQPISEEALEKIKKKLLKSSHTDESLEITTSVDEDLIGGFVINIGDKQIDASVAHKLKEAAKAIGV